MSVKVTGRSIRRGVFGLGLCAVAAIVAVCLWWLWDAQDLGLAGDVVRTRVAVRELLASFDQTPIAGARLVDGLCACPTRGHEVSSGAARSELQFRLALARADAATSGIDGVNGDAARSIVRLAAGDLDAALRYMEFAVGRSPNVAAIWSDASAIYSTAAERLDRPELWIRALAFAERALRLQPGMEEASFNRSLALEGIGLLPQAHDAWSAYANTFASSEWRAQAVMRRQTLDRRPKAAANWENFARKVLPQLAGDSAVLATGVRERLREWIERDALPAWARATIDGKGREARAALERCRRGAEILRAAGGDVIPLLGVSAIEDSEGRGHDLTALARAHLGVAEAQALFDRGQVANAAASFRLIAPTLVRLRSPYARWAAIYDAVDFYARGDYAGARARLLGDAASDVTPGFEHLRGRRAWLSGLIDLNEGRLGSALRSYAEASTALEAAGEVDSATAVAALRAENLFSLGARREAWRLARGALRKVGDLRVPRRQHLILQLAGLMSMKEELPDGALPFQTAVIEVGEGDANRPATLVEGYLHRARIYQRLSLTLDAGRDLGLARSYLARIRETELRRREEAEVDASTADVLAGTNPEQAIVAASRALDFFAAIGSGFRMPGLYVSRGRAERAVGSTAAAERDFNDAIRHFEEQRQQVSDPGRRRSLFLDGWTAYAEMVRLQAIDRRDVMRALEFAERARARTLLERLARRSDVQPLPLVTIQQRLSPHVAVLFYVVLPDRLFIWVVSRADVRFVDRPVSAALLASMVDDVRRLMAPGSDQPQALRAVLERLSAEVFEPVRDAASSATSLVIVPDGALHALPFAALIDLPTGRYLTETHIVAVAPSLNAAARRSAPPRHPTLTRALVVGSTAHRVMPGAAAPALPFATREAAGVASIYGSKGQLLVGRAATVDAVIRGLREVDVFHFAGHAVADNDRPERSRLLLSPARSEDDGWLDAGILAALNLRHGPVVVLAACSTNAGPVVAGEGVLSIARPFIEAGASSVVATLWEIDDETAAGLFTTFHAAMKAGLTPAAALAEAQRAALRATDPAARSPARWAWAVAIGRIDNGAVSAPRRMM